MYVIDKNKCIKKFNFLKTVTIKNNSTKHKNIKYIENSYQNSSCKSYSGIMTTPYHHTTCGFLAQVLLCRLKAPTFDFMYQTVLQPQQHLSTERTFLFTNSSTVCVSNSAHM